MLINFVDNAIKFSFPQSIIQLQVYQENRKVIFSVSDSGIGFNSRNKQELYKKFTSRSRVGTANEPSTGIGL